MTICIGVICDSSSRVIMASDSMLTSDNLSIQFEHKTPKLIKLSNNCVAATAGDALGHTELFALLGDEINSLKLPTINEIVEKTKQCYKKLRKNQIVERILEPRGFNSFESFYECHRMLHPDIVMTIMQEIDKHNYGVFLLIGGVDKNGSHLYSVVDPGTSINYNAIGFQALGSGEPHALAALIANGYNHNFSTEEALLAVYEAKKVSEKSPGVGSQITNISIIDRNTITELTTEQVQNLDSVWKKGSSLLDTVKEKGNGLLKSIKELIGQTQS